MPRSYYQKRFKKKMYLIRTYPTKEKNFYPIEKKWNVPIPFGYKDIEKVKYDNT